MDNSPASGAAWLDPAGLIGPVSRRPAARRLSCGGERGKMVAVMNGAAPPRATGGSSSAPAPLRVGSRVLLVSNRLPVTLVRGESTAFELRPSDGGLATALWPMHQEGGGLWLGWPGPLPDGVSERRAARSALRASRLVPVPLGDQLEEEFYHGFANATLWPLLHYRPHLARIEEGWWTAYVRANRLFARKIISVARPDDVIWLHDFHLMLVPRLLRRHLPDTRIGFFWHTPFPSAEIFRILPWRRELLEGLLAADVLGFQVYAYLRHFQDAVAGVLGLEVDGDTLWTEDRQVRLGVFPIGVDADRFHSCSRADPEALGQLERLRAEIGGRRLILGVDRMDYSKGIPERLLGYERFLERYPAHRGKVELLQVGVPSREDVEDYKRVRCAVEQVVGRINGRFATPEWTPVKYLYQRIPFARLCALYRYASVALVTPLRDGMNLVCKEYVACQRDRDGVLVLSEFAGAAAELIEAVLVNPYDPNSIAGGLHSALVMPRELRVERMRSLARRVWAGHVRNWAHRFLRSLAVSEGRSGPVPPRLVGPFHEELTSAWRGAGSRLVLLDYDGTLRELAARPELARPDAELLALLQRLGGRPDLTVVLISGRDRENLQRWFGGLPLSIVAEHGRWLRPVGGTWQDQLPAGPPAWLGRVREILDDAAALVPGSIVEEKSASLAWHYRTASPELASQQLGPLQQRLRELNVSPPVDLLQGSKVLEVRVAGISKAAVLTALMATTPPTDLILALGDDLTDEEMFAQLPATAWTVHVGSRPSRARFSLASPVATRTLLRELLAGLEEVDRATVRVS